MLKLESDAYNSLTNTEKDVLHFIIDNQDFVIKSTSKDIAEKCSVSKTVIINLSKKIGFEGFNEYKYYLKNNVSEAHSKDDLNFVCDTMNSLKKTLLLNQQDQFDASVKKILEAETIYVLGRGSSKFMALYLTHQLMTLKIKAIVIQDFNHFDVIARTMNKDDLMIAISLSGETNITVNTANVAAMKQRKVISCTAFSNNSLSNVCETNLYFASSSIDTRIDDTVSRTPMLFLLEQLIHHVSLELKNNPNLDPALI